VVGAAVCLLWVRGIYCERRGKIKLLAMDYIRNANHREWTEYEVMK
jgi:hypothetical protein